MKKLRIENPGREKPFNPESFKNPRGKRFRDPKGSLR